jgi:acetate---CoA ligase (ADP-forming)
VSRPTPEPSEAVLRDGTLVLIRSADARDRERIEDYLAALSEDSRRLRFGTASVSVTDVAARAIESAPGHLTLIALHGPSGEVVGGTQYFRQHGDRAEVSVSVADRFQGRGLGSILIGRIAEAAAANGIATFVATVLPDNHRMLEVFRESGFAPRIRALPGSMEVEFPTIFTDDAARVFEVRATEAARNAVRAFLAPEAVAVIGASRDPGSIGGRLFRNLLLGGFDGVVYPVNPKADAIHGVEAYGSILDVPRSIDVAFICVPAELVPAVARECSARGVRGIVVISAGFAETGGDGPRRQEELLAICREGGMRLIGPNCMGLVNTASDVNLNGTFATVRPLAGRVGFLSQSGALGIAVMKHTADLGLGLSSFVSVGNRADISSNDFLCHWENDPATDVVLLYLESFGNPRRFATLARRISANKPIVAMKSGRSAAGARASSSHTGALLRASDAAVDALFRQCGVIRTDTLSEMLDVAVLLTDQPVPKGNRLGIITNAGGLGILCADVAAAHGLSVKPFSESTSEELRAFLPKEASIENPVDMIASATGEDYARAIDIVGGSDDVDSVIVIYIPPVDAAAPEITAHVTRAIRALDGRVTVLTSFLSPQSSPRTGDGVPSFPYPEQAAIALARATVLGAWRRRPAGRVPAFEDARIDEAASILAAALGRNDGGWLSSEEADRLLTCYGIAVARSERALTPEEAAGAADRIGGVVALKALGPLHKTEVGAVRLGIAPGDVASEALEMRHRLEEQNAPFHGFLVQEMVEGGVEMLVGVADDPTFGPIVACGAGGTAAELLRDVSVRVPPITDPDAQEMVRSLSTFPLLDGYRGALRVDVEALEQLILRVGALVDAHPAVTEMDCNPVAVTTDRAVVLDVRVRAEAPPPSPSVGAPL